MSDLISRQDVLDYIDTMPSELTSDGRRMIRRIRLTEYIESMPSAENHKLNVAEYIHDNFASVWEQAEKELEKEPQEGAKE